MSSTDMEYAGILDTLASGIAQLEYSLLLGAGASVGATGGNGRALPTSAALRDALVSDFGIETGDESVSLAEAYDYLNTNQPSQLADYLRSWLRGCQPSWQNLLTEFPWRRIWTFNIDDVVENAYKLEGRQVIPLSWNERFTERDLSPSQQIVHLHGLADRLQGETPNSEALVFSTLEYARAVASPRTWHKVFFDEFAGRPFLVIGARLVEEFDLAEVVESGSAAFQATGYPSVLVVPSIPPIRRDRLQNAGFTIIEATGEQFARDLLGRYKAVRAQFDSEYQTNTPGTRRFQQQFINLRHFTPHDRHNVDFYGGYQPTWNTITNDDDAVLDATTEIIRRSTDLAATDTISQKLLLLTGHPGSGKSTGLLRVAQGLISHGMNPFLFRGEEYLDIDATVECLRLVPRAVILVDDVSEFATTIEQLAERCEQENVKLLLISADRSGRRQLIRDRIDDRFLSEDETHWYGKLSSQDVDRILDKLYSRGRLGKITRWARQQQRNHFVKTAGRRLFDAMSELEGGLGFKEKVRGIYYGLGDDRLKNLYAAACICYEQATPLPVGIGSSFAGVAPRSLPTVINQKCEGVLLLTNSGIRPPHRITASLVVSTLARKERYSVSLSLAKSLAPHVDERAMRTGTSEYRIVRNLMDQATIIRLVGLSNARPWYEDVREYYDWNGRYWDQRALLESKLNEHDTARSYAERSVQVYPHPFAYNTLGTVLLHMAIKRGDESALLEGLAHLEHARGYVNWGEREHPFVTFFILLNRFAETWGIGAVPDRARRAWVQWMKDAHSSTTFSHPMQQNKLETWNKQWLMHGVAK